MQTSAGCAYAHLSRGESLARGDPGSTDPIAIAYIVLLNLVNSSRCSNTTVVLQVFSVSTSRTSNAIRRAIVKYTLWPGLFVIMP